MRDQIFSVVYYKNGNRKEKEFESEQEARAFVDKLKKYDDCFRFYKHKRVYWWENVRDASISWFGKECNLWGFIVICAGIACSIYSVMVD